MKNKKVKKINLNKKSVIDGKIDIISSQLLVSSVAGGNKVKFTFKWFENILSSDKNGKFAERTVTFKCEEYQTVVSAILVDLLVVDVNGNGKNDLIMLLMMQRSKKMLVI